MDSQTLNEQPLIRWHRDPQLVGAAEDEHRVVSDDGETICTVYFTVADIENENGDESRARADLIAAAPELRHALQRLLEWCRWNTSPRDPNSPHDLMIAAVAAIDKSNRSTIVTH
jgi:hypothetical protein